MSKTKSSIIIKNIKVSKLNHTIKDPEAIKLLPKRMFISEQIEFDVDGAKPSLANAYRREALSGFTVKKLACGRFTSTDVDIIDTCVVDNIGFLSIKQDVRMDARFKLQKHNDTEELIYVTTNDITAIDSKTNLPFESDIILCTLSVGKKINIDNIYIKTGYGEGLEEGHARFSICSRATITVLDVIPLNLYEEGDKSKIGVSSSESDPQSHRVIIETNGEMDVLQFIKELGVHCINKLEHTRDTLTIISKGKEYTITLIGETHTIGEILRDSSMELFGDKIEFTASRREYNTAPRKQTLIWRFSKQVDIEDFLDKVFKNCIDKFVAIGTYF